MKRRERETLDYFRFDAVDWLTSPAVSCMTPAQEGAFIRLLAYQAKTKDCSLPDVDAELAALSRLGEAWATDGVFVRAQFEFDPEKPGRIFNKKLRKEWSAAWKGYKSRKKSNLKYREEEKKKTSSRRLRDDSPTEGTGEGEGEGYEHIEKPPAPPRRAAKPPAENSWNRQACEDWIARYGGTAPGARIVKALKPLVTKHGWVYVRAAWLYYLSQTQGKFGPGPEKFASTFGEWSAAIGPTPAEQEQRIAAPKPKALEPSRGASLEEIRAAQKGDGA